MSGYTYDEEAERRQAQQDHEFIWGVINNDEHIMRQLPPGRAEPGTFLHFLQQGDLSEAAFVAFDPEALPIMQSLRQYRQNHERQKETVVLSEWHDEWVQSEQQQRQQRGSTHMTSTLLAQPANIDLRMHKKSAQNSTLDYWGTIEEAPIGTIRRYSIERQPQRVETQSALSSSAAIHPTNSQNTSFTQQVEEASINPESHMQQGSYHPQFGTAFQGRPDGYHTGY